MNKLLVLTSRYPYPVNSGGRLRIYNICKALASRYEITLASICERPEEMQHVPPDDLFAAVHRVFLPKWRSYSNLLRALPTRAPLQVAYYRSREFRNLVHRLLPSHDLVLAHLIRTAQFIPPETDTRRILEMTDAISMNYERMKSLPDNARWTRFFYAIEAKRVARYEGRLLDDFDKTWLISEVDKRHVDGWHENVEVIPNGVHFDRLPYLDGGNGSVIAFIGNMGYAQNQDACFYFARRILPLIRKHADLRFRVVGYCPEYVRDRLLRIPAVEVSGTFEVIGPQVQDAFCGICSVRAAAGMQNKVLEYLAMGLPCVTTLQGAEGIRAHHGVELLVYHSDEEAARQVLWLHGNPEARQRLAAAGRDLVRSQYDWQRLYQQFGDSVADLLDPTATVPKAG